MSTLQEIYEEVLFLLPDQPKNKIELAILLIHSINIKEGMKNNGISENDDDKEWVGIAEGWDNPVDGIYSLRYKNPDGEFCQFKFVVHPTQTDRIFINAIKIKQEGQLYSFELPIDQLNFDNKNELLKSNLISGYKKAILIKIVKKIIEPQTNTNNRLLEQQQQHQPPPQAQPSGLLWNIPRRNPFQIGDDDLQPFSNNAPIIRGNLMGPQYFNQQQQPQQPHPFAPPGARIDPWLPYPSFDPKNPNPDPFGFGGGRGNQFPF